jgi:hypothetical protein
MQDLLIVKAGGTYTYHSTLKGWTSLVKSAVPREMQMATAEKTRIKYSNSISHRSFLHSEVNHTNYAV